METVSKYHIPDKLIIEEKDQIAKACNDPSGFEVLYKKYYKKILLFVYQRVNTKDDALDVTSQVFLKALINIRRYTFKGVPFSAWLYRIALNELNLMFRKNKLTRALNVEMDNIGDIAEELELAVEEKEIYFEKLTNALAELAADDLTIIEMRFFDEMPFDEIGDILHITGNNAKVKVYRIIDKLKKSVL